MASASHADVATPIKAKPTPRLPVGTMDVQALELSKLIRAKTKLCDKLLFNQNLASHIKVFCDLI